MTVQGEVVRAGAGALRFEVRERDVAQIGGDGEDTERTELREARALWSVFGETYEYRFSMHVPADFPILDLRLVTAQWKQRCKTDCNRSPIVAQRYRQGVLFVTIENAKGRETVGKYDGAVPGRWLTSATGILGVRRRRGGLGERRPGGRLPGAARLPR